MDVSLINPFIRSTRGTFAKMMRSTLSIGKPFIKKPAQCLHQQHQISAFVELRGDASGIVAISLSEKATLAIASHLMQQKIKAIDADCLDAIREFANLIVGGAKHQFAVEPAITVTIPRVLRSQYLTYPTGLPVLVLPCECSCGKFILQVAMSRPSTSLPERAAG